MFRPPIDFGLFVRGVFALLSVIIISAAVAQQPAAPVDVYQTDRSYWQSLWWRGEGGE